jgi:hypothetical protein
MLKVFEKNIKKVRVRCSVNLLLKCAGRVLIIGGIVAATAVMIQKLLALTIINTSTSIVFGSVFTTFIFAIWLYKWPSKMQVSLLLDERMKLKERFSTNLKMSEAHDEFSEAARNEAINKAQSMNLKGHFPIRLSRGWAYSGALWLTVIMLFTYMPQKDLLGILSNREKQHKIEENKEELKSQVKEATASIKLTMKKINDPNVADALNKLDKLPPDAKPQDVKREAIRQLGDLSEKIKDMQKSSDLASMKMMQQMLKQLKSSQDSFSQKLRSELSKGNFGQAAALLRQMQKELNEGKLSEEQKKQMAEQMQALAKALENLAKQNSELEKELEQMGLNKEFAKMSQQQLLEALQKQGLSSDKIDDLLQKTAAANMARQRLSQMSGAMAGSGSGSGGQLSGDELADAIDQLDGLESLQQQMNLTEASLGGQNPWQEGLNDNYGPGTGGPGQGMGERASDDSGDYGTKKEKVDTKTQKGPIIASWYFKDEQVEGQAERSLSDVIQAGRDSAAEAISENEIPRKYEESILKYFGNVEDSMPASKPVEDVNN